MLGAVLFHCSIHAAVGRSFVIEISVLWIEADVEFPSQEFAGQIGPLRFVPKSCRSRPKQIPLGAIDLAACHGR